MNPLTLAGARVLITGGAGLIGSHIADRLVREEVAEIVVLDNFVRGRRENLADASERGRLTVVEGDIRDRKAVDAATRGIDVVFHQAALRITQCAEEPELAIDVLVNGTYNVVDAAVRLGVRKVVAASSASVYGLADRFPTGEDHHPYNNRTLYGSAKLFNESLLRTFHEQHGLDYVALRYFNVYGSRMDIHGAYTEVMIRWMERIASGQPPVIFGNGLQTMDFVHVDDVARANAIAAKSPRTDRVYNVASGVETSLNELAGRLIEVMTSAVEVEHGPTRKVNPVARRLADTRRAYDELGFEAEIGLDEGLRTLVTWWQHERANAVRA